MQLKARQHISTQIWRPAEQPTLEFASIGYQDFQFGPHFHEHYVMLLVEEGINL